ncbi:substrate-binding domain-containing protein [Sphingomonas sp. CLY1604]|uniref:substrate-binding domain-containing protein n=1 Tax=Sphingomonas sp. CLY1604 TaxID=3457786 RepID=UPI003FD7C28A
MDIRTLARHLDLSIGTVSRALNGKKDVNPVTRERVIAAAAEHGYVPNQSGRALRRGRTGIVGFMLTLRHDSAAHGDPFFMALFEGIQAGLVEKGIDLVILLGRDGEDQLDSLRRSVSRGIADGWLLSATQRHDARIDFLLDRGIPFATLGRSASGGTQPWIDLDFEGLVDQAIRRFLDAGHRRIGLVAPPATVNNSYVVIDAYRDRLEAAGVPFERRLIHQGAADARDGEAAARALMGLTDPPTALLAMGETAPTGLYKGLLGLGFVPGRDVSVIGSRANPFTDALSPRPTCFALSLRDLGVALAKALLPLLDEDKPDDIVPVQQLWPMQLVAGDSETTR